MWKQSAKALGGAMAAIVFWAGVGFKQEASAQDLSAVCASIAAGALNQSVAAGTLGTTLSVTGTFKSGEKVTGTITNASNSLLVLGSVATLFSGETGTLTRSFTFSASVTLTVLADIQAGASSGASISVTCAGIGGGTTGGTDMESGAKAGLDAINNARPSTRPSGLPSRFNPPDRRLNDAEITLLIRLRGLERELARAQSARDTFVRNILGVDPTNETLVLADAVFVEAILAGVEVSTATNRLNSAAEQVHRQAFPESKSEIFIDDREMSYSDHVLGIAILESGIQSIIAEINKGNVRPTIGSKSETPRLSFAQSDKSTFRFSTQGTTIGGSGKTWLWSDGALAFLSGNSNRDGQVFNFRLGLVHAVNDRTDIGAFVAFLAGHTSQNAPDTELDAKGFGFGTYLKTALGNDVSAGLSLYVERLDADLDQGGVTASFDQQYAALYGEISKSYSVEGWTIVPSLSVGVVSMARDAFTDSLGVAVAESSETYTTAGFNVSVARSVVVDWSWVSEVALTGKLEMGIDLEARPDRGFAASPTLSNGEFTGALNFGATFALENGASLDLRLGHGGIGGHSQATTVGVNYSRSF